MLAANTAAMRVRRREKEGSSFSIVFLCEEEGTRLGVSGESVRLQYDKLYPGRLHPLLTKPSKKAKNA